MQQTEFRIKRIAAAPQLLKRRQWNMHGIIQANCRVRHKDVAAIMINTLHIHIKCYFISVGIYMSAFFIIVYFGADRFCNRLNRKHSSSINNRQRSRQGLYLASNCDALLAVNIHHFNWSAFN
ncbi:hypothetical protein D3C78_1297670 [compost metagenome]